MRSDGGSPPARAGAGVPILGLRAPPSLVWARALAHAFAVGPRGGVLPVVCPKPEAKGDQGQGKGLCRGQEFLGNAGRNERVHGESLLF